MDDCISLSPEEMAALGNDAERIWAHVTLCAQAFGQVTTGAIDVHRDGRIDFETVDP